MTDNLTPTNKNDDVEVTYDITIPQGQKSHSFSMMVPKSSNQNAKYTLFYTVGNDYAPFGWYSDSGTVAVKEKRTQLNLNAGNVNSLNLQLLPGKVITGKIVLGNAKTTLPKDMKYSVTAIQKGSNNNASDDDIIVSREVTVPGGKSEAEYKLIVPLNTSGSGYMVYYTYQKDGYKESGYYHTGGTTRSESTITLLDVSNNISGIDLKTMPFTVITGRLYLPEGLKAPSNGIEAIITAQNKGASSSNTDDFSFTQSVTIAKDSNSVDYIIGVPVVASDYKVFYTVSKNTGYITEGFYSTSGTVTTESKATLVDVTENLISGINLTLQKNATPTPPAAPGPKPKPDPKPEPKPEPKPDPKPTLPEKEAKYDLNGDGYINVYDLLDLARVIVKKYDKDGFEKDLKQYEKKELTHEDMKVFWEVFKPFTNNKYKVKWFNNVKNWFMFGQTDKNDSNKQFDWKNFDWKNWELRLEEL